MNLGLDIRIPTEYVSDEHQRLRAYKRIAEASDAEKAGQILAELRDRYGPPPPAVSDLIEFSVLKSQAEKLGVESVERRQGFLNLKFHPESRIDPTRLMDLVRRTQGAQFTPAGVLRTPKTPLPRKISIRLALLSFSPGRPWRAMSRSSSKSSPR